MSNLPEWIEAWFDKAYEAKTPDAEDVFYALSLAWEALEQTNIEIAHNGNFIGTTKRPTLFSVQDRVVSALRRIEELGK